MNGKCGCGKCKGGAVSNQARVFLKRARAVARRCRDAGLPSPFTVNSAGKLVVNPAVSEAQRRYLNVAFGHDWAKAHHFDNTGVLPERKGTDNDSSKTGTSEDSQDQTGADWTQAVPGVRRSQASGRVSQDRSDEEELGKSSGAELRGAKDLLQGEVPELRGGRGKDSPLRNHVGGDSRQAGWSDMSDLSEEIGHLRGSRPQDRRGQRRTVSTMQQGPALSGRSGVANSSDGVLGETESTFFGRFFKWLTNAKSAPTRDTSGQFSSGDDDADEKEAAEKGVSVEELRKHREAGDEIEPVKNRRRRVLVANARRCPECGGKMEDGECEECDYTENADPLGDQDRDADDREIQPSGGDARPDWRHNKKLTKREPIDVVDDDGDPYLDEDDHSDLVRQDQIASTRNAWNGPDPHEATKQAVASTVMSEHTGARDHAMGAMDSSADDDSDGAVKGHLRAAKVHEDAATGARGDGDHGEADNHDQAAALHRKAASMHQASMSFNKWFATNMPEGGAFTGAKAAGYSPAQAAAMAGKLEGSYDSSGSTGKGGSSHTSDAKEASAHAERTKSKSAHRAAASAHKTAAEFHKGEGNTEMASSHASAARSHAAKAARMTRNNQETTVNWRKLLMNDPLIVTNMPEGGAFTGAKAAGYSTAQAAAMAGKLEGSYDSSGGTGKGGSSHTSDAKEASAHAERTKSKSAHRAAASAHKTAAEFHKGEGNTEMASSHASAARSHAAKAARAVRNSYIESLIENCTCAETRHGLQRLITNEPDAVGQQGEELFAGRDEEDDQPGIGEDDDDDGIPQRVRPKKTAFTGNSYLSQLPPDIRETITEARAVVNREKQALVQRLTANIRNPTRREYRIGQLMGKGLSELRGMLELVGNSGPREQPMTANEIMPLPMYGPEDATIISNAGSGDDDVLDCPTINFKSKTA